MVFQVTYARALKDAGQVDRAVAVYRDAARRWPSDATLLHDLAVAARDAAGLVPGPAAAKLRAEAPIAWAAAVFDAVNNVDIQEDVRSIPGGDLIRSGRVTSAFAVERACNGYETLRDKAK